MNESADYSPRQLREHVNRLPRFPLGHLPTPLEFAERFSDALGGPRLFLKRDDCTGLLFGGNKTRHNEFLIADALQKGADTFVWGAGVQSNNCRQTAAACVKARLDCHLVLGRGKPLSAGEPDRVQGNLLLDHLAGASYEIVSEPVGAELDARIAERADEFKAAGRNVYMWDRDAVKPLAAVSYVLCLLEIVEQAQEQGFTPDALYVCSAGSTGSGLALAAAALGCDFPVRSICPIRWEWDTQTDMCRIANRAAELIGIDTRLKRDDFDITFDYIGPGYGRVSDAGLEAIQRLARAEAVVLDPVYSGKAMAGLIDHVRNNRLAGAANVVFVHTGGTPALFAFTEELTAGIPRRQPPGVAD
ncbi:MAG: D-cysteine desulfhydrase family protein [Planctomycetaceae bacterium]